MQAHPAPEDCQYYLCGPPLMIAAVLATLDGLGVDRASVFNDDFGSEAMSHRIARRRLLALAGGMIAAPWIARAASPLSVVAGRAFATSWQVALPDGTRLEALRPAIAGVLARIDREMSPWRPDGHATRFNRARAGTHRLPPATPEVARRALDLARRTDGAFDPTVGPRVAALGFGPIRGTVTGWQSLRDAGGALRKTRDGATLDLCGIAKGHALDRVAGLLRLRRHEDTLIEIGGELLALGVIPTLAPGAPGSRTRAPAAPTWSRRLSLRPERRSRLRACAGTVGAKARHGWAMSRTRAAVRVRAGPSSPSPCGPRRESRPMAGLRRLWRRVRCTGHASPGGTESRPFSCTPRAGACGAK